MDYYYYINAVCIRRLRPALPGGIIYISHPLCVLSTHDSSSLVQSASQAGERGVGGEPPPVILYMIGLCLPLQNTAGTSDPQIHLFGRASTTDRGGRSLHLNNGELFRVP